MWKTLLAVILITGSLHPAFAAGNHCDEDLKQLDAAMVGAKLNEADLAKVKASRATAGNLHKAKDNEGCEAALADAKKLLGISETHDK